MSDIITYKEFTSPHVYKYGECMVYQEVQYQCININGTDGKTGFKTADWRALSSGSGGSSNGYFPQGWG